jgi:hypothetical protein
VGQSGNIQTRLIPRSNRTVSKFTDMVVTDVRVNEMPGSTKLEREIVEQKTINTMRDMGNTLKNDAVPNAATAKATDPAKRYVSLNRYSMVAVKGSPLTRTSLRLWRKGYRNGSYAARFSVLIRGGAGRR